MPEPTYADYLQLRKTDDAPPPSPHADDTRIYANSAGVLHALQSDGTDTAIGSGGGGSQPVVDKLNGLRNDYQPPASVVLLDPRAQPWEAGAIYTAEDPGFSSVPSFVTPTADPTTKWRACYASSGFSGSVEPDLSGGGSVDDNDIQWGGTGYLGEWQPDTPYSNSTIWFITANGRVWKIASASGTSSGAPPEWASAPNAGDTVTDNDITWVNDGPVTTWDANTEYQFYVLPDGSNYYSDWILPTVVGDWIYQILVVLKPFVTAGPDEPDWHGGGSGSGLYALGDGILWEEATSTPEALVLTGMKAQAGGVVTLVNAAPAASPCTVTVVDQAEVEGTYDAVVDPPEGDGFDNNDANYGIAATQQLTFVYIDTAWAASLPGSLA